MKFIKSEKIRYLLVGGYNTVFGYTFFVLLLLMFQDRVHYLVLLVLSHVVSVTNAYVAYKLLVFRTKGKWFQEYVRFNTVYLIVLLMNLITLPALVEIFSMNPVVGQAWFVVVTVTVSYLGHKHFSFKRTVQNVDG